MMRIITGKARGTKLNTLEGDATRPTSERAKEAVFSMIQFELEGREILDLFAGSGQLGLEALSRGASSVVFVEKSPKAATVIDSNIKKTKLNGAKTVCSDVDSFINTMKKRSKYDIIFIDPPYALHAAAKTCDNLFNAGMLKETSIIICESEEEDIFDSLEEVRNKFEVIKKSKYGVAHITILKPRGII